jgi:hypothetical protein
MNLVACQTCRQNQPATKVPRLAPKPGPEVAEPQPKIVGQERPIPSRTGMGFPADVVLKYPSSTQSQPKARSNQTKQIDLQYFHVQRPDKQPGRTELPQS